MTLIMRQFRSSDSIQVWNLHIVALRDTGAFIEDTALDDDLHNIQHHYIENGGEFLVVEESGTLIGMGAIRKINETCGEVKRMRVLPAFQGKGIGKRILVALIERAKDLGFEKLTLDTSVLQTTAQRLYEKYGFIETGRGTIGGLENIFYEKRL